MIHGMPTLVLLVEGHLRATEKGVLGEYYGLFDICAANGDSKPAWI